MKKKQLNVDKYNELCAKLPDFLQNYCYSGLSEHGILTRTSYVRDILIFLRFAIENFPYFPDKEPVELELSDLAQITANDINTYLMYMKEKYELSDATRAKRKTSISMMYRYLVDTERKLEYNPVSGSRKVTIPEKDFVVYLTEEEQNILLNGIYTGKGMTKRELVLHPRYVKRDLAIIFLFLDMGLRVSELQGIDIGDIDFSDCSVIVNRKRNKFQKLWFSDQSREYLSDYIEQRRQLNELLSSDTPLFVTLKGDRLSVRAIQIMLQKYLNACLPEKANVISIHKLRSSFAMEFYKKSGGDILALQKRLGHSSISTTNIYARASASEMQNNRNWKTESSEK